MSNPVGNWPQFVRRADPPSTQPFVTPSIQPTSPTNLYPTNPRPAYTTQLRQPSGAQLAPYVEVLRNTKTPDGVQPAQYNDRHLREALIQILASVLATGRERVSVSDLHWRLRVPPHLTNQKGRDIARVMLSLGWVRSHYGTDRAKGGVRVKGWVWREWSVSQSIKLEFPEDTPIPVVRRHRAPISIFYGDDVPLPDPTPEGIWAIIRYPLGPRLKIGMPRAPAKTHRWGGSTATLQAVKARLDAGMIPAHVSNLLGVAPHTVLRIKTLLAETTAAN